jgi:hypothetical protein
VAFGSAAPPTKRRHIVEFSGTKITSIYDYTYALERRRNLLQTMYRRA